MNEFDDETNVSPELAAAIDAGVYRALAEAAPRMINTIRQLRAAGATWADIEVRIATWPRVAGEGSMRLWLDRALRHMARQEQATGAGGYQGEAQIVQGIWFADDPASVTDLGAKCEHCGAGIPRGARLCDVCAQSD